MNGIRRIAAFARSRSTARTTEFPNSLTHAGVYGVGPGAGSIGVHGSSDVDNAVGVFCTSVSSNGYGVYARNFANRALWVDGNASQARSYNGIVKAIVYVLDNSTIVRCYNSQLSAAAATTPPCVFSVARGCVGSSCSTDVDFHFQVGDRFWSATIEGSNTQPFNRGLNIRAFDSNSTKLQAYMFGADQPDSSDYATPFMLIVR